MEIIRLENIVKKYNGKYVLNHISRSFEQGKSAAFTGHNGCGKSTLLKCMAGLLAPDEGSVRHTGSLLFHYIPEKFPPTAVTAGEFLLRMGQISGIGTKEGKRVIEEMAHHFFMEELLDMPMKVLSKGTLQKTGVIQALLKKPDVLLLDEPLSGQDEASQKVFVEKICGLRSEGVTIFMVCHEKNLVEAIADEIYEMREGNIYEGKL